MKRLKRNQKKPTRVSSFNWKICDELCEWLSEGKPLTLWCKKKGNPKYSTVMKWLWHESPFREEFNRKYERAREMQAECLSDQIVEICDDNSGDTVIKTDRKGRTYEAIDYENVQRARLQIDTRKWIASKLRPKRYGESANLKLSDTEGGPVTFKVVYENKETPTEEE